MKIGMRCLLLLLLAALLLGCADASPVASERLGALLAESQQISAGTLYDSALLPYEEGNRLSEELVVSLYSRADGYLEYTGRVESAAVYLSSGMEADYLEVAVFVCYGSADTDAVAEMCLRRARLVSAHIGLSQGDALILRSGRTVYLCIGGSSALRSRISRMA